MIKPVNRSASNSVGGLLPPGTSAPDDAPPTTYTYDPEHPVPTIGGSFSGVLKRGASDQREHHNEEP